MILKGYCEKQNKDYSVDIEIINATTLEDTGTTKYTYGRIECEYCKIYDCDLKICSIEKQNNIKR